ncbi:response regulator [Chloroflexia bacterium SDU3-3]|nr:response regulator [Chloroflexia bacterium SDU3-3]
MVRETSMHTEPILVVDDDPTIREVVTVVLQEEGFHVIAAHNGIEALKVVERLQPGLVLLDMNMPLMNGWEFAEAYRRTSRVVAPIIVMTAGHSAVAAAADIDANGVLAKPFALDELIALARYWLAERSRTV